MKISDCFKTPELLLSLGSDVQPSFKHLRRLCCGYVSTRPKQPERFHRVADAIWPTCRQFPKPEYLINDLRWSRGWISACSRLFCYVSKKLFMQTSTTCLWKPSSLKPKVMQWTENKVNVLLGLLPSTAELGWESYSKIIKQINTHRVTADDLGSV